MFYYSNREAKREHWLCRLQLSQGHQEHPEHLEHLGHLEHLELGSGVGGLQALSHQQHVGRSI